MKQTIKFNGNELKKLIRESIKDCMTKRTLNEDKTSDYSVFEAVRDMLGDDTFISEVYNYMNCDDLHDFLDCLIREYDLPLEF